MIRVSEMKAIFFDIDGTLLSKNTPVLTEELLNAFCILRKKGILLFLSTGRHMIEIKQLKLLDHFSFDGYITLNGGYCLGHHHIIHKESIPKEDMLALHNYFLENKISALYVEEDDLYCNFIDEYLIESFHEIHSPLPKVKIPENMSHREIFLFCPFLKEGIHQLMQCTKGSTYTQWFDLGYDIVSKRCSKSVGIQKVLDYFHIDVKETMAFGDGMNDMEMLKLVGTSVAMGNSIDELKNVCDYVTDDVDHFGVLKALQHYRLLEE